MAKNQKSKGFWARLSLVLVAAIVVAVLSASLLSGGSSSNRESNVELLDFSSMDIISRVDNERAVTVEDDVIQASITTCTTGDEEVEAHSIVEFSSVTGGHHIVALEVTSTIEAGCTFSGEGCPTVADTCNPPVQLPIPNQVDRLAEQGVTRWVITGRSDPTEREAQPESFESEEFKVIVDDNQ